MISRLLESVRNVWVLILVLFVLAAMGFSVVINSALRGDDDAQAAPETTTTQEQPKEDPSEAPPKEGIPSQEPGPSDEPTQDEDEGEGEGGAKGPDSQEEQRGDLSGPTYSSGFPKVLDRVDIYDSIQDLEVAPENKDGGYDRELFPHWSDSQENPACNMRWMTLYNQSPNREWHDEGTCTIAESVYWVDPYGVEDPDTGEVTNLQSPDPSDFDIDHVVALEAVWASGGDTMSEEQREAIANDPINLVVTDASANRSKGSQRADTYLPPDPEFRCEYVQRYVTIKDNYDLTVTQAEFDRLSEEWSACS